MNCRDVASQALFSGFVAAASKFAITRSSPAACRQGAVQTLLISPWTLLGEHAQSCAGSGQDLRHAPSDGRFVTGSLPRLPRGLLANFGKRTFTFRSRM